MKTKVYTNIEQSRKLLALGIPAESADMHYLSEIPRLGKPYNTKHIPCWSLAALLELMPNIKTKHGIMRCKMDKTAGSIFPYMFYYQITYETKRYSSPVDAAIDMIIWLKENKYI